MRTLLCTLTLAFFCALLAPQQAQAQYYCSYGIAWGTSYTWQSGGVVYGYSSTELDYCAGLWYDPETFGLFSEGDPYSESSRTLVTAYTTGYADIDPADIEFWYTAPRHNELYSTESIHYVREVYQYYNCFYGCGYYWYDPWGFGFAEGYGGPSFYGYGGAGYWSGRRRRLGTTIHTIQYRSFACQSGQSFSETGESCQNPTPTPTPPPTPTPSFTLKVADESSNDITDTTQPVLLDARTTLKAIADPADSNTTFQWTISGDAVFDQNTSATSQNVVVRWPKEGTFTASVTAMRSGGGQRTAKANIKVSAPEFVSMTAVELPVRLNPAGICMDASRPSVTLGCGTNTSNSGIEITAAAKVPPKFISAVGDGRLKFVQIVTTYASRVAIGSTQLQCRTGRSSPTDQTSGWMLDGSDPYAASGTVRNVPVLSGFNNTDGTATIRINDTPGDTIGSLKEYFRDDFFETYAVYFTGEVSQPRVQRVVGVLPWGWQGKAVFDDTAQAHQLVSSTPTTTLSLTGAAVPGAKSSVAEVRGYQGNVETLNFANCGSTATPTPTPPPNAPPKVAGFVSQDVPFALDAGQNYTVTVTMRNNGSMTWTPDVFKLGSQSPHDNVNWGTNRAYLSAPVAPGADGVFTFNITAPSYAGTYNFQWRMVHEGVEWFGDWSPVMQITVSDPYAYCDWYQESNCYNRGGYWDMGTCSCYGGVGDYYNY